ncbi:hypothetical protein CATMIT_01842, partial [Catenibacterium mitsuokai DSM 15897]
MAIVVFAERVGGVVLEAQGQCVEGADEGQGVARGGQALFDFDAVFFEVAARGHHPVARGSGQRQRGGALFVFDEQGEVLHLEAVGVDVVVERAHEAVLVELVDRGHVGRIGEIVRAARVVVLALQSRFDVVVRRALQACGQLAADADVLVERRRAGAQGAARAAIDAEDRARQRVAARADDGNRGRQQDAVGGLMADA